MTPSTKTWRPDERAEALLAAALLEGARATSALRRFQALLDRSPRMALRPVEERLLPLLTTRHDLPASLASSAKAAYREARLKTRIAIDRAAPTVSALLAAGVRPIVLKGAALGLLIYRDPGLRPMADLDLLVAPDEVPRSLEVLHDRGFLPSEAIGIRAWPPPAKINLARAAIQHGCGFVAPSGLSIDLHWAALSTHCGPTSDDRFRAQAIPLQLGDLTLRTLSPAHHLVHALVHGLRFNPTPPWRWVADAHLLITRAGALDGPSFSDEVTRRGVAPIAARALRFLGEALESPGSLAAARSLEAQPTSRLDRWRDDHNGWPWDRPKPARVIAYDALRFVDGEPLRHRVETLFNYAQFRFVDDGDVLALPRRLLDKLVAPRVASKARPTPR